MELYYDPNIRILVIQRRILQKWRINNLKVSFWRLYWNSSPGAKIYYQQQIIPLTPDRIVLVPPNTEISQRLSSCLVTHFYTHFLADAPFDRLHSRIYVFKPEAGMLTMIKTFPASAGYSPISGLGPTMAVRALIHSLLARIPVKDLQSQHISDRLIKSIAFLEAHVSRAVSNKEIAQHLGLSVNAMLCLYKHELSRSPQKYLQQKRIERACAFLHNPQWSIKQVAEEAGFCDRYYFSRIFKKHQGLTPCKYRRQFR